MNPIHLHIYNPPPVACELRSYAPDDMTDPPKDGAPEKSCCDAPAVHEVGFGLPAAKYCGGMPDVAPKFEGGFVTGAFAAADPKGAAVKSSVLDRVNWAIDHLRRTGASEGEIASVVSRIVHSPILALVVRLTPSRLDDAALEMLKALFPA